MDRIIAGTMTWGEWGRNFSTDQAAKLIEQCVEIGLTSFDHADIYGGYTTEAAVGRAFKKSNVNRDQVIHISKCGIQYPCDERPLAVKHYDYSKQHIIQSVEQSLKNLETDYLDVLLLHRPSPLMEPHTILEAFSTLRKEGKVKEFGVSNFSPSQLALLQREIDLKWNQIECSLSHSTPLFDGSLDYHQTYKIGSMAWSPLGNYFKAPKTASLKNLMQVFAEKYNVSEDQLLLAWLLKHPAHIHPVVGTTQIERLKKAQETTQIQLDLQDWFLMLEEEKGEKVP